jgi:hypothetical protein
MRLEFFRQIFKKMQKCQFSWDSAQWEPGFSMRTDGLTDDILRVRQTDRLTDWQTDRLTDWQTDRLTWWQKWQSYWSFFAVLRMRLLTLYSVLIGHVFRIDWLITCVSVAYRGGFWGIQSPLSPKFRSFEKAEQNSQFRGKYIRNNLIRIQVSLICKLSGTPD